VVVEYYENGGDAVAKASWSQTISPTPTSTPIVPTPTPTTTGFTGEYWNIAWTANPQIPVVAANLVRTDAEINFDWGQANPGAAIGNDNFLARWTKTQNFTSGTHKFSVTADDGVRLYIDNNLVIDKWQLQGATTYTTDQVLTAGNHTIRMEYYEHQVDAVAKLNWTQISSPTPTPTPVVPTPTPTAPPAQTGFSGQYFNNMTLSGAPTIERVDNVIDFDWDYQSPDAALQYDFFSARWTKSEMFQGGTYRFTITSDDGLRIKIDGNTVYDQWFDQSATPHTVDLPITGGLHSVVIEYYENDLTAVCRVSWTLLP
jgi:hypothetical protein